jgi:hypothetical protein
MDADPACADLFENFDAWVCFEDMSIYCERDTPGVPTSTLPDTENSSSGYMPGYDDSSSTTGAGTGIGTSMDTDTGSSTSDSGFVPGEASGDDYERPEGDRREEATGRISGCVQNLMDLYITDVSAECASYLDSQESAEAVANSMTGTMDALLGTGGDAPDGDGVISRPGYPTPVSRGGRLEGFHPLQIIVGIAVVVMLIFCFRRSCRRQNDSTASPGYTEKHIACLCGGALWLCLNIE